jgi:hypothetical protein
MQANRPLGRHYSRCMLLLLFAILFMKPVLHAQACTRLVLEGAVQAGCEWKAHLGEGWVFRIVPVPPMQSGYSGWDLVVDRADPAGFPDALYLATPPFGSINEREVATTFGLRAQDAIGWNPRSFRFLIDPKSFRDAQQAYGAASSADTKAMSRLLELQKNVASGELRILDARLVPGTADPAPFAQQWALAASRVPHQIESSANSQGSARGELRSIHFRLTLWFPQKWKFPPDAHPNRSACGQ